jgi:hypothetical protein
MNKDKFIITVIFFIMAILNYFGVLSIDAKGVFGITSGALMICISTCFEGDLHIKGVNIWKIVKYIFYFTGWILIVVTVYLKESDMLKNIMIAFDSNTLMLLSLGFTFLSLIVSETNQSRQNETIKEESRKLDDLITKQNKQQIKLKQLIDKIADKKRGDN